MQMKISLLKSDSKEQPFLNKAKKQVRYSAVKHFAHMMRNIIAIMRVLRNSWSPYEVE